MAGESGITYRRGRARDCEGVQKVFHESGFVMYDGPEDGPTEAHFIATWNGRWAERLSHPDQVFAVAEYREEGAEAVIVGFGRMQRDRPRMRMSVEEAALHEEPDAEGGDEGQTEQIEQTELTGPTYDAELMSLFVLSAFQGCGIGSNLFRCVSEIAREEFKAKTAFCWCVDLEQSRKFYANVGGELVGRKFVDTRRGIRPQTAFAFQLSSSSS
ncbi:unnamed protein product [Symbiodinium natans]|uniref:N-acetyltransferase domain-containing protein n=1 Tax=Symbiodinium natans TaxID=878477 RepID=A0A812U5R7_9DINO|nr:unnamed protein product [Symbiodinium natans]